jgi:hypothetical protein
MRKVLSEQADFRAEIPLLQLVIKRAGHLCYFLPKFHCELNPIEMCWGCVKICMILFSRIDFFMLIMFITIGYRCLGDGTFKMARQLVPELLNACEVKTICAFYRKAWRYMDAYE